MLLLGGRFKFESNSRELLRLVDAAYQGLPPHRLSASTPDFRIKLLLSPAQTSRPLRGRRRPNRLEPPPLAMLHGAGLFGGATETSNFVVLSPQEHAAVVVISPEMLDYPYHTRYEMIEFAVFTLASRAQRLVPLHAACVGLNGRGVLLLGSSGSGKSTVALHCLLNGFDFLSEDSAFVAPKTMRATGTANFLHVRANSLHWLGRSRPSALIRESPIIRRRSGVEKFEVDLRRNEFRLAQTPLTIVAVAFLSKQGIRTGRLLKSLSKAQLLANMPATQAYGASLPQWRVFSRNLSRVEGVEVRRGRHPSETVDALRSLLVNR
jgi:hypothetical protein